MERRRREEGRVGSGGREKGRRSGGRGARGAVEGRVGRWKEVDPK